MNAILFNVQQAVLTALSADANVKDVLGDPPRLYDHVPPDAVFPYVACGPAHIEPYDTKDESGFDQIVTLNIWSRHRGGKETRVVFQALYNALHRAPLAIAGQAFLSCAFHSADFALDSDGLTYHAAARFVIVTQGEDS